jgi:hypothetical protein
VQVEEKAQLVVGGLLDRPDLGAAGVVDQHVDAPEALERGGHRGLALGGIGDVQRPDEGPLVAGEVLQAVDAP